MPDRATEEMTENDQVLQEHRELIVGLGQLVVELFMRVLALEAVLKERGALSPTDLRKMAREMQKAFPSRTTAGAQAELDSFETHNQQSMERLRDLLLHFEGPKQ